MSLPAFSVHRPDTLGEAAELLARYEGEAQVYMGGTELLLLMKRGLSNPSHLIDCKRIPELGHLRIVDDAEYVIGAGVTHRTLETNADVALHLPELAALESQIANVRVRNVGTIGGNLCFAEPHSDPATLLMALGAHVEIVSDRSTRRISLEEFFVWAFTTSLEVDELMTKIAIPRCDGDTQMSFKRVAFRDRPSANVALVRRGSSYRLVVGAVGAKPTRLRDAEEVLASGGSEDELVEAVRDEVEPLEDAILDIDYKRHLAAVLTMRAARTVRKED